MQRIRPATHLLSRTSFRRNPSIVNPSISICRKACRSVSSTSRIARPELNQTFQLPDGRTVGFAEYGASTGFPLLYLHGFPSSRLELAPIDSLARKQNLRLIAPDRPGFGLSSPHPHRTIPDYVADVGALAHHLRLERFAVLGGSGGGPYALACAHKVFGLPKEQLVAVGVMAGAPPWKAGPGEPLPSEASVQNMSRPRRLMAKTADYAPGALRIAVDGLFGLARWLASTRPITTRLDAWLDSITDKTKKKEEEEEDRLTPAERRELLLLPFFEAFAQGAGAMVQETQLLTHDWGFRFEDVDYNPIQIWHGTHDTNAPISMIRYLANRIPHARLREYNENHYTLGVHLEEILTDFLDKKT